MWGDRVHDLDLLKRAKEAFESARAGFQEAGQTENDAMLAARLGALGSIIAALEAKADPAAE
jgi:hypothetical protein